MDLLVELEDLSFGAGLKGGILMLPLDEQSRLWTLRSEILDLMDPPNNGHDNRRCKTCGASDNTGRGATCSNGFHGPQNNGSDNREKGGE